MTLPKQRDFVKTVHLQFSRFTKNHIEIISSMPKEVHFTNAIERYDLVVNIIATGT